LQARVFKQQHPSVTHDSIVHLIRAQVCFSSNGAWDLAVLPLLRMEPSSCQCCCYLLLPGASFVLYPFELIQTPAYPLNGKVRELMHAISVKLREYGICSLHFRDAAKIPGFHGIQDQYHGGIEGLLAHGPTDQRRGCPRVEEKKCRQQIFGRCEH
jgi:hypothetical protein